MSSPGCAPGWKGTRKSALLELDRCYDWTDPVIVYNQTHPENKILLVIYPAENAYNLQVAPKNPETFEAELSLPANWAGRRGQALAAETGLPGSVFCHVGRFLAVFQTLKEARLAAEMALNTGDSLC